MHVYARTYACFRILFDYSRHQRGSDSEVWGVRLLWHSLSILFISYVYMLNEFYSPATSTSFSHALRMSCIFVAFTSTNPPILSNFPRAVRSLSVTCTNVRSLLAPGAFLVSNAMQIGGSLERARARAHIYTRTPPGLPRQLVLGVGHYRL